MKIKYLKKNSIIFIAALVAIIDQLSKRLIINLLGENEQIVVITKLLKLNIVRNTGAAFSLFSESTNTLGFLSFIVSIGLIYWIFRVSFFSNWKGFAIALLLGGSIGNGIDRWLLGHVIDFIEIIPINFPIFNFADISINISIICLIIDSLSRKSDYG